jgi:hypothetical protein
MSNSVGRARRVLHDGNLTRITLGETSAKSDSIPKRASGLLWIVWPLVGPFSGP